MKTVSFQIFFFYCYENFTYANFRGLRMMFKATFTDITKVFRTYQTFLYFCRNLNMFIKKKLKYFTRPKQISPDLSGVSGDFRIVCFYKVAQTFHKTTVEDILNKWHV